MMMMGSFSVRQIRGPWHAALALAPAAVAGGLLGCGGRMHVVGEGGGGSGGGSGSQGSGGAQPDAGPNAGSTGNGGTAPATGAEPERVLAVRQPAGAAPPVPPAQLAPQAQGERRWLHPVRRPRRTWMCAAAAAAASRWGAPVTTQRAANRRRRFAARWVVTGAPHRLAAAAAAAHIHVRRGRRTGCNHRRSPCACGANCAGGTGGAAPAGCRTASTRSGSAPVDGAAVLVAAAALRAAEAVIRMATTLEVPGGTEVSDAPSSADPARSAGRWGGSAVACRACGTSGVGGA